MNRIIKIGMDVHSTNYTLCAMEPVLGAEDRIYGEIQVAPDYKAIVAFIASIKMKLGLSDKYSFECGYEAGCLGYTLYTQLTSAGIKCVILAPTTMLTQRGKRIKTEEYLTGIENEIKIESNTDDSKLTIGFADDAIFG